VVLLFLSTIDYRPIPNLTLLPYLFTYVTRCLHYTLSPLTTAMDYYLKLYSQCYRQKHIPPSDEGERVLQLSSPISSPPPSSNSDVSMDDDDLEQEVEEETAIAQAPSKRQQAPTTARPSKRRRKEASRSAQPSAPAATAGMQAVFPSTDPAYLPAAGPAAHPNEVPTCLWSGCGKVLDNRTELEEHLYRVHLDRDILGPVSPQAPQACLWTGCPRVGAFSKRYLLTSHVETNHSYPRFVCKVCHEGFAKSTTLEAHKKATKACSGQDQHQQQ